MWDVIVSNVKSGRVVRRRFPSRGAAETFADRRCEIASRFKRGLRAIRVEVLRSLENGR